MFTMFHKIAQCSLLLTFIAQVHSQQIWRIINGTETDIQEAPYTVSLLQDTIYGWDFFCGATLAKVNSVQVVITAAHCVASPGPPDENGNPTPGPRDDGGVIKIKAGTTSRHEGPFRIAEDIIWHEGFNWEMYDGNDIAVIFLEKKFKLSDRIREAKLPVQELGIDSLFVTGWGETKARSETLLKINLPLLPNDECSRHPEVNATVPDIMLCTYWAPQGGGSATCPGTFKMFNFAIMIYSNFNLL